MPRLPECSAHSDCARDAFLLLDNRPVCRTAYDESDQSILPKRPTLADRLREVMGR